MSLLPTFPPIRIKISSKILQYVAVLHKFCIAIGMEIFEIYKQEQIQVVACRSHDLSLVMWGGKLSGKFSTMFFRKIFKWQNGNFLVNFFIGYIFNFPYISVFMYSVSMYFYFLLPTKNCLQCATIDDTILLPPNVRKQILDNDIFLGTSSECTLPAFTYFLAIQNFEGDASVISEVTFIFKQLDPKIIEQLFFSLLTREENR